MLNLITLWRTHSMEVAPNARHKARTLNKTLVYDIHRSLARDFTSVDEDLKTNFDRELSYIGAIEDRFYGNDFKGISCKNQLWNLTY